MHVIDIILQKVAMIVLTTNLAARQKSACFDTPALQLKRNVQQSIWWKLDILVTFREKKENWKQQQETKLKSTLFLKGEIWMEKVEI